MVVIQVKRTETESYLYECSVADSNDKVIRDLCNINNLRDKISRLSGAVDELANHGPSKPETEKGIDEIQEKDGKRIEKGPFYNADPLGNRNGNAPSPQLQEVMRKTCEDAKAACGNDLAARGVALTVAGLREKVSLIRGAVTMAYPMGLPDNDPVRLLLEEGELGEAYQEDVMGNDYLDPNTATLWWAGKEFFRDQTVGDRVGKNEKTKVVGRLQKKGGGAPVREPAVSEAERMAMMAWYHKKQEEAKALTENEEDAYLASSWADGKALKRDLLGTGSISWKAGGGMR